MVQRTRFLRRQSHSHGLSCSSSSTRFVLLTKSSGCTSFSLFPESLAGIQEIRTKESSGFACIGNKCAIIMQKGKYEQNDTFKINKTLTQRKKEQIYTYK